MALELHEQQQRKRERDKEKHNRKHKNKKISPKNPLGVKGNNSTVNLITSPARTPSLIIIQ